MIILRTLVAELVSCPPKRDSARKIAKERSIPEFIVKYFGKSVARIEPPAINWLTIMAKLVKHIPIAEKKREASPYALP